MHYLKTGNQTTCGGLYLGTAPVLLPLNHRRRIELEDEANVVASFWGGGGKIRFIPCCASCFASVDLEKQDEFDLFFHIDQAKQIARQQIEQILPTKQTQRTLPCLLIPAFFYGLNPHFSILSDRVNLHCFYVALFAITLFSKVLRYCSIPLPFWLLLQLSVQKRKNTQMPISSDDLDFGIHLFFLLIFTSFIYRSKVCKSSFCKTFARIHKKCFSLAT